MIGDWTQLKKLSICISMVRLPHATIWAARYGYVSVGRYHYFLPQVFNTEPVEQVNP